MPYIGRELDRGNYLKLDDISSSFNNSLTTFNLTNGGKAFYPGSAFSILVVLAGVVQEPETAYQINQAQITFASAPLAGDQFFCIALGVALGVNTPANGSVNGTQLAKPFNYDGYFYLDDTNNRVGIATATPQKPLHVVGEGQFDSVRVLGDLTVDGTTTTLDTVVTEVDKLEVGANNNTVGVAITQSGSGANTIFTGGYVRVNTGVDSALELNTTDDGPVYSSLRRSGTRVGYYGFGGSGSSFDVVNEVANGQVNISTPGYFKVTTNGTEKLRVTSGGLVGIGTVNPDNLLHLSGTNTTVWPFESDTSGTYAYSPYPHELQIQNHARDVTGSFAGIYFHSGSSPDGSYVSSARIAAIDSGNYRSDLAFGTRNTNFKERLRIRYDGKVGIGTASPEEELSIQLDSSSDGPTLRLRNPNGGDGTYTGRITTGDVHGTFFAGINFLKHDSNDGEIRLRTKVAGSNTDVVTIVDGGVGIKTTSPDSAFHVNSGAETVPARFQSTGTVSRIGFKASGTSNSYRVSCGAEAEDFVIYTSNSEKIRVDSVGRLLIGRTTNLASSAERLTIDNGMALFRRNHTNAAAVYIRNEDSTANTRQPYLIFMDGGGNRGGFGIQNDASRLWISGQGGISFRTNGSAPSQSERLRITSGGIVLINDTNVSTNRADAPLQIETGGNGNALNLRARVSDNIYSYLNFQNNAGSQTAAHIYLQRDASNNAGTLVFGTASANTNTPTERFTIRSDGRIAIGTQTINTDSMLSIHRSSSDQSQIRFTNTTTGEGGNNGLIVGIDNNEHGRIFNMENNPLRLGTNNTERFRITSGGFVNIGGNFTQTNYTAQVTRIGGNTDVMQIKGSTGNSFIRFTDNDATSDFTLGSDDASGAGSGAFVLYDRNNSVYRVVVNSSGNIGVRNTGPSSKVHIGDLIGSASNDANTTHTSLIIKQTNNDNKSGFYIERSGERKGYYMWMNPGGGSGDGLTFTRNNNGTKSNAFILDRDANLWAGGTFYPLSDNSYDLGSSSNRWRNVYTTDLQLSNEGSQNDVDGTWGSYTIQEGEDELFLINRRNGKKYKFNLTEVN